MTDFVAVWVVKAGIAAYLVAKLMGSAVPRLQTEFLWEENMRDLSELRIKPLRSREPAFPPPDDEQIHAFEVAFQVRLPTEYIQFLRTYNGGRSSKVNTFTTSSSYECSVGRFFYLLPEDPSRLDKQRPNAWEFGNLWSETKAIQSAVRRNLSDEGLQDVRQNMSDKIIPFATDSGNASLFVFDYRQSPPTVCLAVGSRGFSLVVLASSFEDFIDGLDAFSEE